MSETKSIKVALSTYEVLKEAAEHENTTLQSIIEKLAREYRTKIFFDDVNSAFEKMSEKDWEIELAERNEMYKAGLDGLEEDSLETW